MCNGDGVLAFGAGLSDPNDPDLSLKDFTGHTRLWIEVGQPEDKPIAKACQKADQVMVYAFHHAAEVWWRGIENKLSRLDKLLGGAGSDFLAGGGGNDSIDGGVIADRINYTDGNTVSYASANAAMSVARSNQSVRSGCLIPSPGATDVCCTQRSRVDRISRSNPRPPPW